MPRESYGLQMLHLLREHLIGAQFSYTVYGTKITNTQSALLSEIARRGSPSNDELCEVLKLHPSTASRTLSHLQRKRMISSKRSSTDQRRVIHQCLKRGRLFAEFSWRTQQEIIGRRMRALSLAERRELEEFLRVFVGDEAFARIVPIQDEPLMAVIFRGLTYVHGVVSGNYVESGFPVSDWLILSEVHYNKRSPSELARLMRVGKATLSLRLKSLNTRGLIRSERDDSDGRRYLLSLTRRGIQALHEIESLGQTYFDKALSPITDRARLESGIRIFTKYVHALKSSLVLTARLEVMTAAEVCQARHELRSAISRLGPSYPLSGYLLHESNLIGRIIANGETSVIIECVRDTESRLRLVNLFTENGSALPYSLSEVAEIVLNNLQKTLEDDSNWSSYIGASLGQLPKHSEKTSPERFQV